MNINIYSPLDSFLNQCLGMMMEAFPFLVLGIILSSAIQVFIPARWFQEHFPKRTGLGILYALIAGFFLPVCDCASVPVFRGLVKKKVPLTAALTFMLASPVVNPVVVLSTLAAFPEHRSTLFIRLGLGVLVAICSGLIIEHILRVKAGSRDNLQPWLKIDLEETSDTAHDHAHNACNHSHHHEHAEGCHCHHHHGHEEHQDSSLRERLVEFLIHIKLEFFEVAHYLIVGIMLSSAFHTLYNRYGSVLGRMGLFTGTIFMMILAFLLSLCSSSDAIVARSFIKQVPAGAVMGFLVVGPMIDIKNTLMLSRTFNRRFICLLIAVVFSISLIMLLLSNLILPAVYINFV